MPIVQISKMMRALEAGDTLIVEATDPAFRADLRAWTRRFGHEILDFVEGDCLRATIVKAG